MAIHTQQAATAVVTAPRVYYVSDRPEAYELWGEVSQEQASRIGRLIAARAGEEFLDVEFRVDGAWHCHPAGSERVAEFIEDHVPAWVAEVVGH
jgi:hypothetical protein